MITEGKTQVPLVDPTGQTLSKLVTTASAEAVFGQPVVNGDTTVIPCSEVAMGMGMGSGSGPVDENGNPTGGGSGGGGAERGGLEPAMVITMKGVGEKPTFDLIKI